LNEYECLQKEIELKLKDAKDVESNAALAVGVTWAWLIDKRNVVPKWAWIVPVLFFQERLFVAKLIYTLMGRHPHPAHGSWSLRKLPWFCLAVGSRSALNCMG
jgi:hypothetical protein